MIPKTMSLTAAYDLADAIAQILEISPALRPESADTVRTTTDGGLVIRSLIRES